MELQDRVTVVLTKHGANGWHISIGCDGKCPRMKRYDKKQAKTKIAGNVILENG